MPNTVCGFLFSSTLILVLKEVNDLILINKILITHELCIKLTDMNQSKKSVGPELIFICSSVVNKS